MISALTRTLSPSSLTWRAIGSIVFGIVALAWPGVTLAALVFLYGAYAMADGVFAIVVAVQGKTAHRGLLAVDGVFGIGIGILTIIWPGITLLALVLMIGVRFLIMGALQIAASIKLRKELPSPILYGLGGLAALIAGIFAFVTPGITAVVLVKLLGVYSLVFGGIFLSLAYAAWRAGRPTHGGATPAAA